MPWASMSEEKSATHWDKAGKSTATGAWLGWQKSSASGGRGHQVQGQGWDPPQMEGTTDRPMVHDLFSDNEDEPPRKNYQSQRREVTTAHHFRGIGWNNGNASRKEETRQADELQEHLRVDAVEAAAFDPSSASTCELRKPWQDAPSESMLEAAKPWQADDTLDDIGIPAFRDQVRLWLLPPDQQRRTGKFDGAYVDCTFGRGGHSRDILEHLSDIGSLVAFDVDPAAIALGRQLGLSDERFRIIHRPFGELASELGDLRLNGVLIDLGVSSLQLDDARRGFAGFTDAALDLRMNSERGVLAADWLRTVTVEELAWVIHTYGEEDLLMADRIAEAIVQQQQRRAGSITGKQLADVVRQVKGGMDELGQHPAKLTFHALRVFLNQEMEQLDDALHGAFESLVPGGRCVIICYKKKESDLVRKFAREHEEPDSQNSATSDERLCELYPLLASETPYALRVLVEPLKPCRGNSTLQRNPRSRGATVHVLQKERRTWRCVRPRGVGVRDVNQRLLKATPPPLLGGISTHGRSADSGSLSEQPERIWRPIPGSQDAGQPWEARAVAQQGSQQQEQQQQQQPQQQLPQQAQHWLSHIARPPVSAASDAACIQESTSAPACEMEPDQSQSAQASPQGDPVEQGQWRKTQLPPQVDHGEPARWRQTPPPPMEHLVESGKWRPSLPPSHAEVAEPGQWRHTPPEPTQWRHTPSSEDPVEPGRWRQTSSSPEALTEPALWLQSAPTRPPPPTPSTNASKTNDSFLSTGAAARFLGGPPSPRSTTSNTNSGHSKVCDSLKDFAVHRVDREYSVGQSVSAVDVDGYLTLHPGDIVHVLYEGLNGDEAGWNYGWNEGKVGWFPAAVARAVA